MNKFKMDSRYKQANKEALLSLCLTLFYIIVWVLCAYYGGNSVGVIGLPLWFELSCLFAPIAFILCCYLIVKFTFKHISLEHSEDKS